MPVSLGSDIGYRFSKSYANGEMIFHQPSVVGQPIDLFENTAGVNDTQIEIDGETLFVGSLADRQSLIKNTSLYEDRNGIDITKYMLLSSISHAVAKFQDSDIQLVSGLPVSYYFKQKTAFTESLSHLPKEFKATIGSKVHDIRINSLSNYVVLQPLGTYMNFILNEKGAVREDVKDYLKLPVLVIDLGFFTLDILSMNGMEIDHKRSYSSNELGSNVAYRIIQQALMKAEGRLYSFSEIDSMIRNSTGNMAIVKQAFQVLGEQIKNEFYGLNQNYGLVLLAGGNAPLIKPSFPTEKFILPPRPATSNVEGYGKMGARLWQKQSASV